MHSVQSRDLRDLTVGRGFLNASIVLRSSRVHGVLLTPVFRLSVDSSDTAKEAATRQAHRHAGRVRGEAGYHKTATTAPLHAPAPGPLLERERNQGPDGQGRGEECGWCLNTCFD